MKKMSLDIEAGKILGVPPDKLEGVLGRVSKKDSDALAYTDLFIPFTISKNIENVFEENARKLGIGNPYWQAVGALESLKGVMQTFSLSMPEWPDLTELFNMSPAPVENQQQTPSGAAQINPQVYNRPSLTLNPITGLTRSQTALLSPADQQYYMQKNRNRVT